MQEKRPSVGFRLAGGMRHELKTPYFFDAENEAWARVPLPPLEGCASPARSAGIPFRRWQVPRLLRELVEAAPERGL